MTLDFHHSFGYRNSKQGVAFYDENTLIFSAGKMCISLDLNSRVQKHFEFTERGEISALVKCGVLIAGAVRGNNASVFLVNTLSDAKKSYFAPSSMESEEFTCLSVSVNLKFVAGQGGMPDWLLVIWLSQTRDVFMTFSPASLPGTFVHDISFHAAGRDELVVVGKNVFKLYEYQEDEGEASFNEITFEKFEKSCLYHTIAWPENENLVVGSSEGKMLFFRGIELVLEIIVEDDLKRLMQQEVIKSETNDKAITSIAVTPQYLLCVYAGIAVLIYEGEEMAHYVATKLIFLLADTLTVVPGELEENPDRLWNITVSPNERDIVATTEDGQILCCRKFCEEDVRQQFSILHHRKHNDPVIGMDVSSGRPLIASCSSHTLILWNYSDKSQELRKMFSDRINSVAIHPTGLYVALSFERYFRTFSILYHLHLKEQKHIPCEKCAQVGYSPGGHLLAVVSNSVIEMYNVLNSELLFKLANGHAGLVTSFDWVKHDRFFVSCDVRGFVCMWDLVSQRKIQEYTSVIPYSSISACPVTGNFIVMGSERNIRCLDDSLLLLWTFKCRSEAKCAVFSENGLSFLVGTTNGYIEIYSRIQSDEVISIQAHTGMISGMKYSFDHDILVTSGNDGCIFIWKTPQANSNNNTEKEILSNLCLIDKSTLMKLNRETELLHLSLCLTDIATVELGLSSVKHEESLRKMAQDHEQKVQDLNRHIARLKEDMQIMQLDSDPKNYLKTLEAVIRQEKIDTALKLNEAYKSANAYTNETKKIILSYENRIDELAEKHSKFSCSESDEIQKMSKRIKYLEDKLLLVEQENEQAQLVNENYKNTAGKRLIEETAKLSNSQTSLLKSEKSKSLTLEFETNRLKQYIDFQAQEIECQKKISGQIDYDIQEKIKEITLLTENFAKLEDSLKSKKKKCQVQAKRFWDMRKLVSSSEKSLSVSKTKIEELKDEIRTKQSEIKSCQEANLTISTRITQLKEQKDLAENMCKTVNEKSYKTIDGVQKKEKDLRAMQDVYSRYNQMLSQCTLKECNPMKLKDDILHLFEENITSADELTNPQLLEEYNFQINKLKNAYDHIKGEPSKASRDKAMAEFRLSQENSKILRQVRNLQKDSENLRKIINEIETGLGLQAAQQRSSKLAEELRNKIEFVILASQKTDIKKEIQRLDTFIEENQKEIERFQTILAGKLRK